MRDPTLDEARPALITRDFVLLFLAHLLFGLSFWPYVLLPVFLQELGADLFHVGLIMGSAALAGILIRPWVGSALNRIGRKRLLAIGGLLFTAANLSYLGIDSTGFSIYLVRLLQGSGMGILMATLFTLAADYSPPTRRTEGIALFGVAGHLSGAIGVLMGEQLIHLGGYHALFISGAVLAAFSTGTSLLVREPEGASHENRSKSFFHISISPALRLPIFGTVAFGLSMTSYMVFLKPYAVTVGVGSVTPFFVAYTLTAVGARLIGSTWPDRFGLKPVLYPAMSSMVVGLLFLPFWKGIGGLSVSGILCGFGHAFIFPILSVMMIKRETEENRGSVVTLFTMLYDAGLLIGAPLLGLIARGNRYTPMFLFAALIEITSLIAFLLLDRGEGAA